MVIKQLITKHGGTAKFRRALSERRIIIPEQTVKSWSATSPRTHREPPPWFVAALEALLR